MESDLIVPANFISLKTKQSVSALCFSVTGSDQFQLENWPMKAPDRRQKSLFATWKQ